MTEAQEIQQSINIIDVIGKHIHLDKKGSEFYGKCPFHDDHKESLQVSERKQIYKCFPCGAGGDSVDFLMRMGSTFTEALNELSSGDFVDKLNPEQRKAREKKMKEWKQVIPVPKLPQSFNHYVFGEPSKKWEYKSDDGSVMGFVCRFDLGDGKKQVLPYTYATNGNMYEWRWMGFDKPRPLYNLDLIKQNPKASILFVEGEKTADAAQAQLNPKKTVATTWMGGSSSIDHTDFSPVNGRVKIFWPDNDTEAKYGDKHPKAGETKPYHEQPGNQAMFMIHQKVKSTSPKTRWVKNPDGLPHKWDCADKDWSDGELRDFVRDNMIDVPPLPLAEPTKTKDQKPPPPPPPKNLPVKSDDDHEEFRYFTILGYDKNENRHPVFYFYSYLAKCVFKYSAPSLTKSMLITMAPLNYWEHNFPGSKSAKVNIEAAQQKLINDAYMIGQFNEKYIRGRGAWLDEDRIVIHTGGELIINRKSHKLNKLKSRYVYEVGEKLGLGSDTILPNRSAAQLLEHTKWFRWDREISAYLTVGWCVIAPFCGILRWRPHIWVTGAAGTGKSWLMDNVLKRLLGEAAIVVQGKTTEAGVRGLLQSDARPVLFDESDVDSHNDKERVQSILALARSSSYHDGGVIGKGTQSGMSKTYVVRSCFAFSSIGVQLNQQSDRSRFTTLGLKTFEGHRTEEDFINFEREWNNTITDEFVQQLQARTISLLPIIIKNSKTFADAVAHVIGQKRIGDQVGSMLAGAYSLISSHEITYDDAVEWVKEREWDEERGLELTKDEYQLFNKIMGASLRCEGQYGAVDRGIGELILITTGKIIDPAVLDTSATNRLRRAGILVHDQKIYISNTAGEIKSLIKDTAWGNNHYKILERLPGAEKVAPRVYYPGCNSRGVSIPMELISEGYDQMEYRKPVTVSNDIPDYFSNEKDSDDLPF